MTYGELSDAFMRLLTKYDALHIEHAQTLRELNEAREQISFLRGGIRLIGDEAADINGCLREDRDLMQRERDEARREVCALEADTAEDQREFARQRGWDCWPETTP